MVDEVVHGQLNAATFYGEVGLFGTLDADSVAVGSSLTVPSLTTTARDAMTAVNGMLIYNSSLNRFQGRENGSWVNMREAILA